MLLTRILSAAVMLPLALLAIWWGGWGFGALICVASAVMFWEWNGMVVRQFGLSGRVGAVGCALAVALALAWPVGAVPVLLLTAGLVVALAPGAARGWLGWGVLYCGLPAMALLWLRGTGSAPLGLETVLWLMVVVWATDSGAYACGRLIGGPLLLPVISPKKTWAGLIGGAFSAALVGGATAWIMQTPNMGVLVGLSAILAVVAQAGDLFESWVKRRWGVKDSSAIIPGHGGVLDRVDGLLTASVVVAVLSWGSGAGILEWR